MPTEYEHRLLVQDDEWRTASVASHRLSQTYLSADPALVIRVRIVSAGSGEQGEGVADGDDTTAYLTIKGSRKGIGRPEYEYTIPPEEARELSELARGGEAIDKTRHELGDPWPGWVVDVFDGANAGLVIAELEVPDPSVAWQRPPWAGQDVTDDDRYSNAALFRQPFTTW